MDEIKTYANIKDAIIGKDIVCTDSLPADVLPAFKDCQVTKEVMDMANTGARLNPCPPFYRGEEVSEDVIASEYFVGYEFKKRLLEVQQAVMIVLSAQLRRYEMAVILPIIYIIIVILQIVLLVTTIKKKSKKRWTILFVSEIACFFIALFLMIYYNNLPGYGFMPGFSYLGEVLSSFAAAFLYFVMFLISGIVYLVISEKKRNISPFWVIVAFVLFIAGLCALGFETYSNCDKVKTTATVVDFRELRTGGGMEYWPVYEFSVAGQVHEADYPPIEELRIGDEVEVYYYLIGDSYDITRYLANTKGIYIPAFCFGILFLFLRRKRIVGGRKNEQTE